MGRIKTQEETVNNILAKLTVPLEHGNTCLQLTKYQEWYDILVKDDFQCAEMLLSRVLNSYRDILLNSRFSFKAGNKGFGKEKTSKEKVNLPLHVAVCSISKRTTQLMLSYGVDVLGINTESNNVLHSAVYTAFTTPKLETNICEVIKWFLAQLDYKDVHHLLFQENQNGLRPIELAAQQGCLNLMKTLFETKGHMISEEVCGFGIFRMHDVTEYEVGERHGVSPINMLAFLEEKKLKDDNTGKIILNPCILGWIQCKIRCNTPLLIIWCVLRIFFVSSFIVLDNDIEWLEAYHGKNASQFICPQLSYIDLEQTGNTILWSILTGYLIMTFLIYIFEIYASLRNGIFFIKAYNFKGRKKIVANTYFFRLQQAFFSLMTLIACIENLRLLASVGQFQTTGIGITLRNVIRSFIPVMYIWSIIYFFQMSTILGPHIITMQGMLEDMAQFMILFIMLLLPFVHVFQVFALGNSESGCQADFKTFGNTAYTLFKLMLYIYDPSTLQMRNSWILLILHVLFVFMVAIMLISFLIAIMSYRAGQIAEDENVTLKINQLAMCVSLEDRLFSIPALGKFVYKRLRKLSFLCLEGFVFYQSVENRFKLFNNQLKKKQKLK